MPCGAQDFFCLNGSEPLVLQVDWNIERKLEITRQPQHFLRGLSFCAVHTKRQTNDQGARVKVMKRIRDGAQELFPVGARQRWKRADSDTQLVGDGHPDALVAQIEREQASGELLTGLARTLRLMCFYFWQSDFCRSAKYRNGAKALSSGTR